MILAPFLNIAQIKQDAWVFAKDCCERWDVPADAPEDLRDRRGRGLLNQEGYRVSALVLKNDFGRGIPSPVAVLIHALCPWVVLFWFLFLGIPYIGIPLAAAVTVFYAVASYYTQLHNPSSLYSAQILRQAVLYILVAILLAAGAKFVFSSLISTAAFYNAGPIVGSVMKGAPLFICLFLSIWPWIRERQKERERMIQLLENTEPDNAAAAYPFISEAATARKAQSERANADVTPFLKLGKATGICSELLDLYAPDKGLPVGLTQNDASTHFLTIGKTGTGKTAGIIRPFVQQWLHEECGGLLLLDGKGDLPAEFADTKDYHLIEPGKTKVGLIEGLLTEDLVDVLTSYAAVSSGGAGDPFWISSGETMLRSACILLEHRPEDAREEFPWTLEMIHKVVNEPTTRQNLLASYKGYLSSHIKRAYLELAVNYFTIIFPAMPPNTAGSVTGTVNSWLAPLMGHRDIFEWCCIEQSEVNPALCLSGGRFGVNCPSFKYGSAGAMVSALLKARVYRAILQRGSAWKSMEGQTQVLVVADEAQEILSKADSNMFPVGRSLGLVGLIGTQSVDELIARLGRDQTYALLNNFRSFAAFQSSPLSMEWVSQQLGDVFRADFEDATGFDVFREARMDNQQRHFQLPRYIINSVSELQGKISDLQIQKGEHWRMKKNYDGPNSLTYKISHRALLSTAEMSHFLNTPFCTIMQINRANVVRRDVVQTEPVFAA